jgi:glycosyltransferase involved in cell wall biosynthesis
MAAQNWSVSNNLEDGVSFHGPIASQDLMEALRGMDVLLHPALEESFGMVVAEAMALGVPVIGGLRSGAVPWIVGTDGILIDVTDPSSICAALLRIARSPGLRAKLSASGCRRVRTRFDLERVVTAYLELLDEVIHPRS